MRQGEADVADLEPLQDLVLETLIEDVDVVGGVELAPVVIVHAHVQALRQRASHPRPHLDVRLERRDQAGAAVRLDRHVARTEAVPATAQLDPPLDLESEVRILTQHVRDRLLVPGSRLGGWRGSLLTERRLLRDLRNRFSRRPGRLNGERAGLHAGAGERAAAKPERRRPLPRFHRQFTRPDVPEVAGAWPQLGPLAHGVGQPGDEIGRERQRQRLEPDRQARRAGSLSGSVLGGRARRGGDIPGTRLPRGPSHGQNDGSAAGESELQAHLMAAIGVLARDRFRWVLDRQ